MGQGNRSLTVAAIVVAAMCLGAASQAAPQPPRAGAAVSAPLVVSGGSQPVFARSPIRINVSAPLGRRATRVLINDRNVTKRVRFARGRATARLFVRRDGVRYGANHLVVIEKQAVVASRSFYLVRKKKRFVRVRVGRGVPVRVSINAGLDIPRSKLPGRDRRLRVSLNGRTVKRDIRQPRNAHYRLSLSATHGLRYGVNRLRIAVTEPRHGRYVIAERRFVVHRGRPLAAAGLDQGARPGMRVRLGGLPRAARGGGLNYRWAVVRKPRGSHPRLRQSRSRRPVLIPDRPGRYVVRQRVAEFARAGAGAARVGAVGVDDATVVVNPDSVLFPLSVNSFPGAPRQIKIGGWTFPAKGAAGTIQVLWLDRSNPSQTVHLGNTWCCDNGSHSLGTLSRALATRAGHDDMVVLVLPARRNAGVLPATRYRDFNRMLAGLGVSPLSSGALATGQEIAIAGVPSGAAGSGWVWRRLAPATGAPQGWLMPDGSTGDANALNFRFQPLRLSVNTRSNSGTGFNEMDIAGQAASGGVAAGGDGFQVVEVDPRDLRIFRNRSFTTNGDAIALNDQHLLQMANAILAAKARGNYVAVQSIGSPGPLSGEGYWQSISDALAGMGANVDMLNRLTPGDPKESFAFFGGPLLTREEVVTTSAEILIDPTTSPKRYLPGSLNFKARMRHDGNFAPGPSGGKTTPADGLYDLILGPPSAWPFSAADPKTSPADVPGYTAALAFITQNVAQGDWSKYGSDLRKAYVDFSASQANNVSGSLSTLQYPGDRVNCFTNAPPNPPATNGFTRRQFCNMVVELQTELSWLGDAATLLGRQQKAFTATVSSGQSDLENEGEKIRKAVDPPNAGVVSPLLYLFQSIAEVGDLEVAAPIGLIATTYDVASNVASDENGPVSDRVSTRVKELASQLDKSVAHTSAALDSILDVAVSDYNRLRGLAQIDESNDVRSAAYQRPLRRSFDRYFASELMPIGYHVWALKGNNEEPFPQPGGCSEIARSSPFAAAYPSAWYYFFIGPPVGIPGPPSYESFIFNEADTYSGNLPPHSLTDPLFQYYNQGGYGLVKSTWFWQKRAHATGRDYIDCD